MHLVNIAIGMIDWYDVSAIFAVYFSGTEANLIKSGILVIENWISFILYKPVRRKSF
jgi:hypothetical protein